MCGRLNIMDMPGIEAFLSDLGISSRDLSHDLSRYNVAPQSYIPTIGIKPNAASMAFWGHEVTFKSGKRTLINTRAETAAKSWTWKESFASRPAVIFANGFYEWQRSSTSKQAYFIHDDKPMALAALWFDDDEPSISIMTEAASAAFSSIHERQPVALNEQDISTWLNDKDARLKLLASPEHRPDWQWHKVSNYVNNARNDGPKCIEPMDDSAKESSSKHSKKGTK